MRLFTGIPLPHDIANKIVAFTKKQKIEGMKWTEPQNLHITLVFLGERDESELPAIRQKIREFVDTIDVFKLRFAGYVWAPQRRPYMIWAVFTKNPYFSKIVVEMHKALGCVLTHEEPIPHITVGRLKGEYRQEPINDDGTLEGVTLKVKKIVLWQSILKKEGPTYRKIEEYEIRKNYDT